MLFRINFEYASGAEDSFTVEGEDEDEIRQKAMAGLQQRRGVNPWSEQLQ